MLSTAIVIFREAFEISLILSIVLAATNDLPKRMPWIGAGVAAGVGGSVLMGLFAEKIAALAEGLGQEVTNAVILFAAAFFIGWTAIWMRQHARRVTQHIKKMGADISEGILPLSTLAVVIGLSILREGSEIVLFLYSMTLSEQSLASIISGTIVGFIGGVAFGMAVYYGLVKLSVQYMMRVTGWILILLVCGLSSKGAEFLSAAGYFSSLSKTVWNTSWLVSDGSAAGKLLSGLIGYSAQPTEIQVIFYAGTLAILLAAIYFLVDCSQQKTADISRTAIQPQTN